MAQGKNARKRMKRKYGLLTGTYQCPENGKLYASKTSAKRDVATQARRDARHGIRAGIITSKRFNNPLDPKIKYTREKEGIHHWKTWSQK